MIIHKTPQFQIYFGTAADAISKRDDCIPAAQPLINHEKFKSVSDLLAFQNLAFLNQTHSTEGFLITEDIPAFNKDGDYLITHKKNIGIGVMTADCLPIIFYDAKNSVAAIAHAGWRGAVAGIAMQTFHAMKKGYDTQVADLKIFFGPSAKKCCYIVDELFVKNIKKDVLTVIERKDNGALCFDLPGLNAMQLQKAGLKHTINTDYNLCTICNHQFFSYRRQGESAGRQMTIIALRSL